MTPDPVTRRQRTAHALIPGGCHTYAKGDDQYPLNAPAFLVRGQGCRVWDAEGREFVEYGMGLRAVTLGHAHERVIEAAYRQMLRGSNFTRPSPIELECAEAFFETTGLCGMIKFAKNGSDTTTAAVRLARAYTGRDLVAICADQPFFSADDWFIGSTAMSAGVPTAVRALTVTFRYNDIASLRALFERYPGRIACVVMEPATHLEPLERFLHDVRRLCDAAGAVLVFDEMITGFRWHLGGGQTYYGVEPDLSTFGKALANGFSVSALVGRSEIMELGGLRHDRERVFTLSLTHGAETHALAAALEVMRVYRSEHVIGRLFAAGERLRAGVRTAVAELRLGDHFEVAGVASNLIYITRDEQQQRSQAFRTLFLQETIRRGVLLPSLVVSASHTDADIDHTIEAIGEALVVYRKALDQGIDKHLVGRPGRPVFRRLN